MFLLIVYKRIILPIDNKPQNVFPTIGLWKCDLVELYTMNRKYSVFIGIESIFYKNKFSFFIDKIKFPCTCKCPGNEISEDIVYLLYL